jgi:hypothetical protein
VAPAKAVAPPAIPSANGAAASSSDLTAKLASSKNRVEYVQVHEEALVRRIAEFEAQRAEFDRASRSKETKLRLRELDVEKMRIDAERSSLQIVDETFQLEDLRRQVDQARKLLAELEKKQSALHSNYVLDDSALSQTRFVSLCICISIFQYRCRFSGPRHLVTRWMHRLGALQTQHHRLD